MNERLKIEDLHVGDTIYIETPIQYSWTKVGDIYVKDIIKRITPKKTKAVTENGKELTKESIFFKEFDEGMKKEDTWTRNIIGCYKNRTKLEKAAFVNLNADDANEINKLYDQIIKICQNSKMKVL